MANFVSYENAEVILTDIGDKLRAVNGAYVLRGSVAFANLPASLTKTMTGYGLLFIKDNIRLYDKR